MKLQFDSLKRWSRRHFEYVCIVGAGLLICLPFLDLKVPDGIDLGFHLFRELSAWNGFADGQIVPQLDPQMLEGFGMATNLFYPPLSTYLVLILYLLTTNWLLAVNLFVILSLVFSGIFMLWFARRLFENAFPHFQLRIAALVAALLYMVAPYHGENIFGRAAHGEFLAMTFVPLLFLGLLDWHNNYPKSLRKLVCGGALILLSHNLSVLIVGIFVLLYMVLLWCNKQFSLRQVKRLLIAGTFIFGIAAFFYLPLLEVRWSSIYNIFNPDFAHYMRMTKEGVASATPGLSWFRIDFGEIRSKEPGAAIKLIIMPIILVSLLGLIGFWRETLRTNHRALFQMRILLILSLVFVLGPWQILPSFFLTIQFPWRFLMMTSFFWSLILAWVLIKLALSCKKLKRNQTLALGGALLLAVSLPWSVQGVILQKGKVSALNYSLSQDPGAVSFGWGG